ncbi:MAG TPA: bifunctional nicotinamidase/pyrazinamidase [Gammaproteobacteria bacterium]|nr:bifunctional nicotinamidase/pyrazinamidase [Gammaproteobacteria bacterium]
MVAVDRDSSALIVVDMQPDFMEGGALATDGGSAVIEPIARLMDSGQFRHVAATQDWHPAGHVSFASAHPGRKPFDVIDLYGHDQVLWPDHCVQGGAGAELHPDLPWTRANVIIRKGEDPEVDSYSGFLNNWNRDGERPPTGLAGYLRERGITGVFLCGLARDFCVKWTAEDAVNAGFETTVLWDLTRPVSHDCDDDVRSALEDAGVHVVESTDLE